MYLFHRILVLILLNTIITYSVKSQKSAHPNIVVILADDLGYGDVSCYNKTLKFKTNHVDKLARLGIRFTDAHSSSAVCSPTRYSLLTGRYAWRTRLKKSVLWQWDPPLIDFNRLTLPSMLKEKGYYTAAIGKWHLGWNWPTTDGISAKERNGENVDYTNPLKAAH